jgi:glycosyltransferase involved in cell wall biosynthesis
LRRQGIRYGDGLGPSIVHAFTPRQSVRELTLELGVPYLVHLEDNESIVLAAVRGDRGTAAQDDFVLAAEGVTAVVDRLLEALPASVPGHVVWPGYDESLDVPGRPPAEIRRDLGFVPDEALLAYTGNVHRANVEEVSALYRAVVQLRAEGVRVRLAKTGWNGVRLPRVGSALLDLGWVRRDRVLELIRAADVLVQPGAPGPFDDYRFPSKLPDYLASGNPVVLPRTNVGLALADGHEALLLDRGDAAEIAAAVRRLLADDTLGTHVGEGGRAFARRSLRWERAGAVVEAAYEAALASVRH